MNAKRLAKALVETAIRLIKGSGEPAFSDLDAVAFDLPHEEGLVYGYLTACGTPHCLLMLLRGESACELLEEVLVFGDAGVLQGGDVPLLSCGMTRMKELLPEYRRILERAEYPPSRLAPVFIAKDPGEKGRLPDREECETLLAAMVGLWEMGTAEQLEGRFELGIVSRVRVRGDLRRPEISVDLIDTATEEVLGREALLAHPDYVDPKALPASDDRKAWKAADMALAGKVAEVAGRVALHNKKAWRQYMGEMSCDDLISYMQDECTMGYIEWFATWYRAQKNAPTILESLLEKSTRPTERALLQARIEGRVSLFEYVAPLSELAFEARDVLTGERLDIDDSGLAWQGRPGMVLTLHLCSVGNFHFVTPMGAWMAPGKLEEALEILEELGLKTPEDYAAEPHLVGRLWADADWLRAATMPNLQNSDGHPLLWHKVDYCVSDAAALDAWLQEAEDLEYDDDNGQWIWLRAEDNTVLGHLQLIDDHLLAEANSKQRSDLLQARLEEVPGIHFESVTTQEINPATLEDLPKDDLMDSGETRLDSLPPEILASLQEEMNKVHMAWLDESIPMLDGKSPRETCTTERGRDQVRHLILSYPDPAGVPGLEVPRAAMLEELGLPPAD